MAAIAATSTINTDTDDNVDNFPSHDDEDTHANPKVSSTRNTYLHSK